MFSPEEFKKFRVSEEVLEKAKRYGTPYTYSDELGTVHSVVWKGELYVIDVNLRKL